MAFQIDPNIPLQAGKVQFDPASILMQAQTNAANLEKHRFEMQKLRADYDAQTEARKQQKAMQMGIASDLAGIQSGTPAQYSQPSYAQTMPTGQMPQGMTGVLASERGQQMPQPQLFGENILQGNVDFNREMVSPAVQGREPLPIDFLKSALKQSMLNRDYDNALKFQKAIQESEKTTNEYYGGLTEGIDPKTGQPVLLAMTKTGAVPSGYAPKPKDPKAPITWPVDNDRVRTTYGLDANGKTVVLGRSSLDSPKAAAAERPEHYFAADGLTGDAFLNTLPPQDKARVRAIVRHDMPYPSAAAIRRDPTIARLAEAVWKADENYSDIGYSSKKTSAKAYLPGQKLGNLILSNASALGHMEVLKEAYIAMTNGDLRAINSIANKYKVQTGSAPEAVFNALKNVIGAEIMKAIVPGGGGVVERQDIGETLIREASNDQFMGTMAGYEDVMKEQYDNMHQDYRRMELPEDKWPTYKTHEQKKIEAANGGKDPYAITKDTDPRRARYLMNHKRLVEAKDYEGANMLTDMYNKGAK